MVNSDVQEMPASGDYFTWTNKTIWSKIDRVFINSLWHEVFDFTLAKTLPPGLSDHTPLLLQFHVSPKPPLRFQFNDMGSMHRDFQNIISVNLPDIKGLDIMQQARIYFSKVRRQLLHLNCDHFKDLKTQQAISRNALLQLQQELQSSPDNDTLKLLVEEARNNCISILSSSLTLLKQQYKIDWIKYGDDSTRFFFAKAKQRKLATYIYSLQDASGSRVEGFDHVGEVLYSFYKDLLGETPSSAHLWTPPSYRKARCYLWSNRLIYVSLSQSQMSKKLCSPFQTINPRVRTASAVVSLNLLGIPQARSYAPL